MWGLWILSTITECFHSYSQYLYWGRGVFSWSSKLPFNAVLIELGLVKGWAWLLELWFVIATFSFLLWRFYYTHSLFCVFICFNAPCQCTQVPNLRALVFGLTPFSWLRSFTLTPASSSISQENIFFWFALTFSGTQLGRLARAWCTLIFMRQSCSMWMYTFRS